MNSRNAEKLNTAAKAIEAETGMPVTTLIGDVGDPAAIERMVTDAAEALGGLRFARHQRGRTPAGHFESLDDPLWAKAIDLSC